MDYQVTKQLGAILLNQQLAPGEMIAGTSEASFYDNVGNFLGVKKHDDDFMDLGGANNMDLTKTTFVTVEKIDLRPLWSDGMVIDDLEINVQRAWDLPRVLDLYNYAPDGDIWETLIITTDNRIEQLATPAARLHYGGFQDCDDDGGLGFLNEVLYAETKIYGADPSRKFTGPNFASYSTDEANYATYLNGTLAYEDLVKRGYPNMISAPSLYIYRVVTSWYAYRSPGTMSAGAIAAMNSRLHCIFTPIAVTVLGNIRKGNESERIKLATNQLLQQPTRPQPSRP